MKKLFLGFMKMMVLTFGTIMLIGGGICSIQLPFAALSQKTIVMTEMGEFFILFLISIAFSLGGYYLIHFVTTNKKQIMNLTLFLQNAQNLESISFDETMAVIEANYTYQPTEFSNGLGEDKLISLAGTNQGSCKIFAFAQLHNLTVEQTLNLFGSYYHDDVLKNPNASDHRNIRNFIKYGWNGICFQGQALS